MPRRKKYLNINVYDMAKLRLHHIYDIFDSVVIGFSGGKDSQVLMHLAHEVIQERGIDKIDVVFRDEELIPQSVVDTVMHYRDLPWVEMLYFCVPLASSKYILGQNHNYIQWDAERKWVRPMPDCAITSTTVFDQHRMDDYTASFYRGRIALTNGMRADESLMRYRGVVNKLNENYITMPTKMGPDHKLNPAVRMAKPIYDWTETDIFKYLYDNGVEYTPTYDNQLTAGQSLRVSTPLHAESSKRFHKLREVEPVLYAQIIELFPEMLVHERYFREYDRKKVYRDHGNSLLQVRDWITDNITDPEQNHKAMVTFREAMGRATRYPEAYPPAYVLAHFVNGSYKRRIPPKATK